MRGLAIALVVGCGGSRPAPPIAQRAAAEPAAPSTATRHLVQLQLSVGSRTPMASRGVWDLTIENGRATLVVTAQEAGGPLTLEQSARATWKTVSTSSEAGPAHVVGDHLALDMESKGDSLWLRCWQRTLVVALPGAQRVHRPGHITDCDDDGMWSPAATTRVDALVCGQGDGLDDGQVTGMDGSQGSLDETLFRFTALPGVELVEVNEDCFSSSGLRLAK
jgi:hypothetical protein